MQTLMRQQMFDLAAQLGYACQDRRGLDRDLAQQIYSRMTNRQGKAVKQIVMFPMSFPRDAARQLFPDRLLQESGEASMT